MFFPEVVQKTAKNDRHTVSKYRGRCHLCQHIRRFHAERLGVHGRKRNCTCCHSAAGHRHSDIENPAPETFPKDDPHNSRKQNSHRKRDHRHRQKLHGSPEQKIPVNIKETAADQRRDIKDQEATVIDKIIERLNRLLRDQPACREDRRTENTDHRSSEIRLHHRYVISNRI